MTEERVQRRLAAILAADVVGYSRLVRADEAGTRARFNAHLNDLIDPKVSEHQGRIVKTTGDGLLVEFASVVDAVQCAIEIQRGMADRNADPEDDHRMDFRIGVNLGDVIIEDDDIHGDGVNVASRLEGLADPGGVCISGKVYEEVRYRLDIGFEDLGEQEVKNIPEPVQAHKLLLDPMEAGQVIHTVPNNGKPWRRPAIAGALVVAIATAGLGWWQPWAPDVEPASVEKMAFKLPDKPSIAVLPFSDFSEKKDQVFFADGLTEEIISNLASFETIFVIARNSTNKFRGKAVDVRKVAEDLGVRYVLEGSIRRAGDDIRVIAQLVDALNGRHIWAGKYDRKLKDLFALQDEITGEIASRLVSKVAVAEFEKRSRKQTNSPEAYALFLRGWQAYNQFNRKSLQRAIGFFKQAIARDPDYGRAYAMLGFMRRQNVIIGWAKEPDDTMEKALELTKKGVALSPDDPKTHLYLGAVYRQLRRLPEAVLSYEKALSLNPGDSSALAGFATVLAVSGRIEEAEQNADKALRVDPHARYSIHFLTGNTYYYSKKYEKSAKAFERALTANPRGRSPTLALRAAAYAQLGKMEEARAAREEFLRRVPGFSIQQYKRVIFYSGEIRRLLLQGLRKAGYPEYPPQSKKAPRLSIVVLPFNSLADDPKQGYLADGITEDLITDLSRIKDMFVIARGTSFTLKGQSVDPKEVAKDLNVRYVLEGSVRRSGDQVRVNAQLIDGKTGAHIWSERFDRTLKTVFSLQNQITGRLASTLKLELMEAESRQSKRGPPSNFEAWDYAIQGFVKANITNLNFEDRLEAKRLLEKALELDSGLAMAWTSLAHIYFLASTTGLPGIARPLGRKKALETAQRAVALDPMSTDAQTELGLAYRVNRQPAQALAACLTALELNPNNDDAYLCAGMAKIALGKTGEAFPLFEKSLRLNPRHRPFRRYFYLGLAHLLAGQHGESVAAIKKGIPTNPKFSSQFVVLASALAWLGRKEEAVVALAEFQNLDVTGKVTIEKMRGRWKHASPDLDTLLEGLRRAGMPEK